MIQLRLQEVAEAKGLNISQVQIGSGLSMGTVRRYWYNETRAVYLDALDALCKFLKVKPGDLFDVERTSGRREDGA
jgi:DNA-binding Xre family transcriptional regulator